MKKLLPIIFLFLLVIAGCTSPKTSEAKIKENLQECEFVKNGVVSSNYIDSSDYEIKEFNITKRKTEKRTDDVYCDVTIKNDYVESKIECLLRYSYYDKGGWILDYSEVLQKETHPIAAINKQSLPSLKKRINNKNYSFNSDCIKEIRFIDGDQPVSEIIYEYTDEYLSISAVSKSVFLNDCWSTVSESNLEVSGIKVNWSSDKIIKSYSSEERDDIQLGSNNSRGYYRSQYDKDRSYSIYVDGTSVYFNMKIDTIDDATVKGSYEVLALDRVSMDRKQKNPTIRKNISSSFDVKMKDTNTGEFEIPFTAELFSYNFDGTGGIIDPCYTSANIKAVFKYDFDKNKWNLVINLVDYNLGPDAIMK